MQSKAILIPNMHHMYMLQTNDIILYAILFISNYISYYVICSVYTLCLYIYLISNTHTLRFIK